MALRNEEHCCPSLILLFLFCFMCLLIIKVLCICMIRKKNIDVGTTTFFYTYLSIIDFGKV